MPVRTMANRKLVLFELNEVPYRVLDDHVRRNPRGALGRCLDRSAQYTTRAEDRVLSPWITWPTVHRGVSDQMHTVRHFGQDLSQIDRRFPPLWKILAGAGRRVGVFGSLHSYPMPTDVATYAFYMPDTFAPEPDCHPNSWRAFQEFNLAMARQSARNVSSQISWKSAAKLLSHLPQYGLHAGTLADVLGQLVDERRHPWRRVRRRTYQTVLGFDLFLHQLERTQPDFCTFFTNHVASSMHRYWAASYPGDYDKVDYGDDWVRTYAGEIDFAMRKFEGFLERLLHFVDRNPEYTLWITSSMGQAATVAAPLETQLYLTDLGRFMQAIGLGEGEWSQRPAMAPEVSVFVSPDRVGDFRSSISRICIAGEKLQCHEREHGFFVLALGQENLPGDVTGVEFDGRRLPFAQVGFENVVIEDQSNSTAYHIPEGILLVCGSDTQPSTERTFLRTTELAPAILRFLAVPAPEYMHSIPVEQSL